MSQITGITPPLPPRTQVLPPPEEDEADPALPLGLTLKERIQREIDAIITINYHDFMYGRDKV